jgi:demethylmenaquinone methyltransferase/2-methoxy-6-polyprenyl-1,4-benzoquinol methylase
MSEFDKVYKHYNSFMKLFNLYKVDEITKMLELKGEEIVGDIGGGTGYLADYISSYCKKVYVIDESDKMLSKVNCNDKIKIVKGNALSLSIEDNTFDCIIISDVLHHIYEQDKLINEIYRLLKPNGKLLILDFNRKHIRTRLLYFFEFLLFGRLYYRTFSEVISMLQNKFKVISSNNKNFYYLIVGEKL